MVNYVIYHDVDTDGFMGLAVCMKWLRAAHPDEEHVAVGAHYEPGWKFEPAADDKYRLLIVDYHLPVAELRQHLEDPNCTEVYWFDHHISAIREAMDEGIIAYHGKHKDGKLQGLLNTQYSGCYNAWEYLFEGEETPESIELATIYDTWKRKHPKWERAAAFNVGLRTRYGKIDELISLLSYSGFTMDVVDEGLLINDYLYTVRLEQARKESFFVNWRGLKFRAMNAKHNSLYLQAITQDKDCAGFLLFGYEPKSGWKVSLFGNEHYEGEVDLSVIAVSYGGGGHAQACGFYTSSLPFVLPTERSRE